MRDLRLRCLTRTLDRIRSVNALNNSNVSTEEYFKLLQFLIKALQDLLVLLIQKKNSVALPSN